MQNLGGQKKSIMVFSEVAYTGWDSYDFVVMVSPLRERRFNKEENGCSPNNFTRASLSVKFNFPVCGNFKLKVQASQQLPQISRSEIKRS